MPKSWKRLTNPTREELIEWFKSDEAESLQYNLLHPVAQDALISFKDQFQDPFPRVESHGSYIFGMFAAPTSIEDDASDFFTVHFFANFDQIVTILRSSKPRSGVLKQFDLSIIEQKLEDAAANLTHPDWSVGMAIARIAEIFITSTEESMDQLKSNVIIDLELVTKESRQIPSNADSEYLSSLYRRTAMHKTEVVSLRTLVEETKNIFKAVATDQVDVRRSLNTESEDLFPEYVEVAINDLLMRTRHLTSIRNNLESDLELMFGRFQEIQNSQQTAVGRRFTGVLSILLLPQLIAGYFGQNFESTPGYRDDLGWAYSLGLIVIVSLIQFYWFKKRKFL